MSFYTFVDKGEGGSADVDKREAANVEIIFLFNNIIIKCQNVDKGRGGVTMWIRIFVFFRPFRGKFWLLMHIWPISTQNRRKTL